MGLFTKKKVSPERAAELAERYMNLYGDAMLRFAYSYLRNMEDAEDVVQESLIRAIGSDAVFENETHEKSYLMQIVKNQSLTRLRYNTRNSSVELNEEIAADEKEDYSYVRDAVLGLPEHEREAIHLFYMEGYSVEEIAKITGRKSATVRSDLFRGREKLKGVLKEGE